MRSCSTASRRTPRGRVGLKPLLPAYWMRPTRRALRVRGSERAGHSLTISPVETRFNRSSWLRSSGSGNLQVDVLSAATRTYVGAGRGLSRIQQPDPCDLGHHQCSNGPATMAVKQLMKLLAGSVGSPWHHERRMLW